MARDWVATTYAWLILDVSFRVFYLPVWVLAKFASCVRSLVRIWSLNNLPDTYSHTMHLCSYVFGHLSADHTYMVMLHKYLRTCMVTLQQTRRVWLHDVSALARVWLFSNWPDTYGHKTQLCPYVSGHISTNHTYMVTRHNCVRTCLVILEVTIRIWWRDATVLVRIWSFSSLTRYVWSLKVRELVRVWSCF